MSMLPNEVDVLISGAGPTGTGLALELARAGVCVLVIDKEQTIYPLPRAAHIDHETLRIFQGQGIADAIARTCQTADRYDFINKAGEVLMRFDNTGRLGAGGWHYANMIHQPSIEALMREELARHPNAALHTSTELVSFEPREDYVEASVEQGGKTFSIKTSFLVGADGARSPVRTKSGIEFDDMNFDEPWLVVDAIVHDQSRLPPYNIQICDPERPTTCVLMGEGRHRWEFMLVGDETPEQAMADGFAESLLEPWNLQDAVTLERKAVYRFNARIAAEWRKGRVLLAGDAAHQMPPFAGQGLCSGLRDAVNLGWKLAAVLNGANESLLDTYQTERKPHVRTIIETAIMMGQTVCVTDAKLAADRDAAMLADRAEGKELGELAYPGFSAGCRPSSGLDAGAGEYFPQTVLTGGASPGTGPSRLDDLLGGSAWLITKEKPDFGYPKKFITPTTIADLTSPRLAPFRASLEQWLDAHDCEAILVRPDRYVFGGGQAAPLLAAWEEAHS